MGSLVAVSTIVFGRVLNVSECLPVGAHVLDQQFFGIVAESGDVVDGGKKKVLLGGRFVSTEDELAVCVSKLVKMRSDVSREHFVKYWNRKRLLIGTRRRRCVRC